MTITVLKKWAGTATRPETDEDLAAAAVVMVLRTSTEVALTRIEMHVKTRSMMELNESKRLEVVTGDSLRLEVERRIGDDCLPAGLTRAAGRQREAARGKC